MIVTNIACYDGSQIKERFAFDYFKDAVSRTGNIIAFLAPVCVEGEFMVDKEDLIAEDFIYSDLSINFIMEIPDVNLFGGVAFQRLINSEIAALLRDQISEQIYMKGDDILIGEEKKKVSVSIAKEQNGAILIHTALNIDAGKKAPDYAYSLHFDKKTSLAFMQRVIDHFKETMQDIFVATSKIRSFI